MKSKHLYLMAWVMAVAAISYYDMKDCKRLPWPPRIIHAAIAFGLLDILSFFTEEVAGVMAIGLVIGTFVTRGWKADAPCPGTSSQNNTGQPQTTAFFTGQYQTDEAQQQPDSYQYLQQGQSGPFQGAPQTPGTQLV